MLDELAEVVDEPDANQVQVQVQVQALQRLRVIVNQSESVVVNTALPELLGYAQLHLQTTPEIPAMIQAKSAAIGLLSSIVVRHISHNSDVPNFSIIEGILENQTLLSTDILDIKDISEVRDQLQSSNLDEVALFQAQVGIHLAALKAIQDIGYAIQTQISQTNETAALSPSGLISQSLADTFGPTLRNALTKDIDIDTTESPARKLLVDIQIATVEALAAITFVEHDINGDETIDNIVLLNSIAAGGILRGNSDGKDEFISKPSAVRAAAISSLERLGALPGPFHDGVVKILQSIADKTLDNIAELRRNTETPQNIIELRVEAETLIGTTAVNIFSRLESQRAQQLGQNVDAGVQDAVIAGNEPRNISSIRSSEPNAYEQYFDNRRHSEDVFRILNPAFAAEEGQELRQSAEVAFQQFYGSDINRLLQAIDEIRGRADRTQSNNEANERTEIEEPSDRDEAVRLAAVRALGGVSYRRFVPYSEDGKDSEKLQNELKVSKNLEALQQIARFLGESLRSSDTDIRHRATYALGQLASFWPDVLIEHYDDSIYGARKEGENTVLDSLFLGLNDRGIESDRETTEKIIATVAHTLSRYGIALEQNQRKYELLQKLADSQVIRSDSNFAKQGSKFLYESSKMQLSTLKSCLKAVIAPGKSILENSQIAPEWYTRVEGLDNDCSAQEIASNYQMTLVPTLKQEDIDNRAAVAAAFALGQIGISDGQPLPSSDETQKAECKVVEDLLWVMQLRDLMAWGGTPPERSFPRTDSVRDSIASYVIAQIDAREHGLIAKLLDAVTVDADSVDVPEKAIERCSEEDTETQYISDYGTRAAIISALDQIGLEGTSLESFVRRTRRLLARDEDPTNAVQAAVTSVVEGSNRKADIQFQDLIQKLQELNAKQAAGGSEELNINGQRELMNLSRFARERLNDSGSEGATLYAAAQELDEANYLLSLPYDSLLACAGANYTLAAIGIGSDLAVKQRMEHIYVYPKPYDYICASNLAATAPQPPVGDEPSLVNQLFLMKRGAIAALGQIDPDYDRLPEVVNCLAELAGNRNNLTPGAECPMRFETSVSFDAENRREDWCLTPSQMELFQGQQEEQFQYYRFFDSLEYGLTDNHQDRLPEQGCPPEALLNEARLPERLPNADQIPAAYQAEGWGLNASQYNGLRNGLKEHAIEALGQIATREPEQDALCTLALQDSAYCNGKPPLTDSSGRLHTLRLNQIEEVALELNASDDDAKQQKLENIVSGLLLPVLAMNNENDKALRNQALDILSRLDPKVFADLDPSVRVKFLQNLGFTENHMISGSIAEECVLGSSDSDLLQQETLCIGLTNLLGGLALNSLDNNDQIVDQATKVLQNDLVTNEQSAIIRASAINAINQVDQNNIKTQIQLLSRLNEDDSDEPRVVDQVIQAFLRSEPDTTIPTLTTLLRGNDNEAWQAASAIRLLGQYTSIAIAEIEAIKREGQSPDFDASAYYSWQAALNSEGLILALLDRLDDERGLNADLSRQILYALGEIRTDNSEVHSKLLEILDDDRSDTSSRAVAAYALGKIGNQHPEVGELVLPLLYRIVLEETATISSDLNSNERKNLRELRAAAAYAIAQMGSYAYSTQFGIIPQEVLDSLLITYNDALNEDSEILRAIILYSLGSLGFEDNRIAELYAASLQSDQPYNIRVIAATYARELLSQVRESNGSNVDENVLPDLSQNQGTDTFSNEYDSRYPSWNQNLIDALIEATKSPEITVRQNAVMALGNRPNFNSPELNASYRTRILDALGDVFWNEREYPSVRLRAGVSIKKLSGGISTNAFNTTFQDLQALEELRTGSSFTQSQVRSPEQALFSARSASLISVLDSSLDTSVLLVILDAIRTETPRALEGATVITSSGCNLWCQIFKRL
ncbi:hypothetical protein [Leptolyngbya sp. Heron Island J]|uniref:hypothetical protein n=1 Tax=Leptolyngbya sp. Heron Island J TaxID=1385935 RepID=UPI0012683CA8|nr:hypothetical protein [Leptolyngbya sp. Heron Island J]